MIRCSPIEHDQEDVCREPLKQESQAPPEKAQAKSNLQHS